MGMRLVQDECVALKRSRKPLVDDRAAARERDLEQNGVAVPVGLGMDVEVGNVAPAQGQ
jgi:hypothetical protein